MEITKKAYDSPQVEIVEVKIDGFVCTSPDTSLVGPGGPRINYPGEVWEETSGLFDFPSFPGI